MNKIFKLFMLAVVVLGFSSCYNEFEEPAPAKVWTKEDFSNSKLISIKDFTNLYSKASSANRKQKMKSGN